jgi:hypothetical protein
VSTLRLLHFPINAVLCSIRRPSSFLESLFFGSLLLLVSSSRILFRISQRCPRVAVKILMASAMPILQRGRADYQEPTNVEFDKNASFLRLSRYGSLKGGPELSYVQTVMRSVFTRQCLGQAFASLSSPWSEICSPTWTYPLIR